MPGKSTFLSILSLCALSIFPAFAQSPASLNAPLVRIGKAVPPPAIDGKLDDAAWKQSVAINEFSVTGSKSPAAERAQVRFVYDDQNLYVSWRCEESLLRVEQQRMHEVKADAKKLDGDVFGDDCVLLFVQPNRDGTVYEFDVNSIGTLFDARSRANDLWKARDASWNSAAKAAAMREDGFWTAELAIPWKAFGPDKPANDASWLINLQRRAAGRGESSSWATNNSPSIHLFDHWGDLVFGQSIPEISAQPLTNFQAGKSTFEARVSSLNKPLEFTIDLIDDKKVSSFQGSIHPASIQNIKIPITTTSDIPLVQWVAREETGKPLYRSPQLLISARSSQAHLKISTAKAWKLYINGVQTREGSSAQNLDIPFPLANVNDIVVEAQSGQAKLQLAAPGFAPAEEIAWRTHPVDPKVLSQRDRHQWEIAQSRDGSIGTTGAPAYLQHTLLDQSTLSYPVATPAFYIAQGTAQQITFLAEGVEGISLHNWQMSLAVPAEFEVLGSSGFYAVASGSDGHPGSKPRFHTRKEGQITIDGKAMSLYRVTVDKPLYYRTNQKPILVSFEVLVRLPRTAKIDTAQDDAFYYWSTANTNTVSETVQKINMRTLPPLNGKQPRKFVWEFWSSNARVPQFDDASLLPSILDTARQAGFNKYIASTTDKDFNQLVSTYGMKPVMMVDFTGTRTFELNKPYLAKHPEDVLVDMNGKQSDKWMCTTQVLGKNWPMYAGQLEELVKNSAAAAVEYDYEIPPFRPPHACYCQRCLAAFRDFTKMSGDVKLTPAIVQKDYRTQWVDFMAWRGAILLKQMKDAVHAADPNVLFTAYSGYYDARENTTKTRYGIDWDIVGKMQAVDEAGMGYGRPLPAITDSIKALRGIPVKFGAILTPYDYRARQPVAPLQRATLLRHALDATGGVLVYTRKSIEGRTWQAVADLTRLTAEYEDLFLQKTLHDIPGQNPAEVQIVKGAGKTLLCVMNLSKSGEKNLTLSIPAALGQGTEYYSGQQVNSGQTLRLKLAPGDIHVYIFNQ